MEARFYFGTISPYSWFAAERIGDLIPEAQWRPVFAGGLFRSAGRVSWGITEERAQRMADCQRRAVAHGLGPIRWPDGWPGNDVLPARAMVVADGTGKLDVLALAAMRACFRDGRDITQAEVLASVADAAEIDGAELIERTQAPAIKEALRGINQEAIAAGVIGVPSVWVNGELYWGDDRLDEAAALASSGRSQAEAPQ
jgi:2-hydroxychromene-2-carboxylate isomerase